MGNQDIHIILVHRNVKKKTVKKGRTIRQPASDLKIDSPESEVVWCDRYGKLFMQYKAGIE